MIPACRYPRWVLSICLSFLLLNHSLCVFSQAIPTGKTYLVLIGVSKYPNPDISPVPFADEDIHGVEEKFRAKYGCYRVEAFNKDGKSGQMVAMTTDSKNPRLQPTSGKVLGVFASLHNVLTPEDTLIVYWAGHGKENDSKENGKRNFLWTLDADPSDFTRLGKSTVSLEDLKNTLNCTVKNAIFILDACRDDPDDGGRSPTSVNPSADAVSRAAGTLAKEITAYGNYAVLFACNKAQRAYHDSTRQHGIFTYYFLEALDKGIGSIQEIADYVIPRVSKWSEKRAQERQKVNHKVSEFQYPRLSAEGLGRIPLMGNLVSTRLSLQVKTNVPNAQIMVDGKVAKDGLYIAELSDPAGERKRMKVVTSASGYATDTQTITLEAGEPQELLVNLEIGTAPVALKPSGIGAGHIYTGSKPVDPVRGDIWINPKDGAEMVYIPSGEFTMGSTDYSDQGPVHKVNLSGYYIYRTPVTVKQYKQYCAETGTKMPEPPEFNPIWSKENHPIVNVSWNDTQGYCRWAGVSLPTEAQWEKAARGSDGRKFPWGNTFDGALLQHSTKEYGDAGGTAPVGSFPSGASPYGVWDMAGNVWQWCSDWYGEDYYKRSPLSNPTGPSTGSARVLRGGSWDYINVVLFRCAYRSNFSPGGRNATWGFRCAVPADSH